MKGISHMKEMILLFNPPAKEQLLKIRSALLPLHYPHTAYQTGTVQSAARISCRHERYLSCRRKLRRRGTSGYNVSLLFFKQQPSRSGSGQPFAKAEPARSRIKPS